MKIKELNKSKTPIVILNKTLDKLSAKVLFPEKLEEANRILKTVGLPKSKKIPTLYENAEYNIAQSLL